MGLTSSDISSIGTSTANLGASIINKSGAGKDRASAESIAKEGTKQAQTAVQVAQIQAKQASKDAKSGQTKIIYYSIAGAILVVVLVVVYFKFIRKK